MSDEAIQLPGTISGEQWQKSRDEGYAHGFDDGYAAGYKAAEEDHEDEVVKTRRRLHQAEERAESAESRLIRAQGRNRDLADRLTEATAELDRLRDQAVEA